VPPAHDWADDCSAPLDGVHNAAREVGNSGRARQRLPLAMARQWAVSCPQGGGGCHGRDAWASAPAECPRDVKLIGTLLVMEAFMETSKPMSPDPIVAELMTSEHVTSESMSPTPRMP